MKKLPIIYAAVFGLALTLYSCGPTVLNPFSTKPTTNVTDWNAIVVTGLQNGQTPKQLTDQGVPVDYLYGKEYAGGFIFHFNTTTGRGMIVDKADKGRFNWGCFLGPWKYRIEQTHVGAGKGNTDQMRVHVNCGFAGGAWIRDLAPLAVDQVNDGWFIPSVDELNLVYDRVNKTTAGFLDAEYMTSNGGGANTDYQNYHYALNFKTGEMIRKTYFKENNLRLVKEF